HQWYHGARFVTWNRGRSDLLNRSSCDLLLLLRLWACGQRASVVQAQRHVHSRVEESSADALAPCRHRRAPSERLVRTAGVVEGEPGRDASMGLTAVGVAFEVDILMLERAPQPLDEDVVHPAAAAVHRDANAGGRRRAGEG